MDRNNVASEKENKDRVDIGAGLIPTANKINCASSARFTKEHFVSKYTQRDTFSD